jgi:hypothetical protein
VGRLEQRVEGGKQLTVGDFTPKVAPQHLNRAARYVYTNYSSAMKSLDFVTLQVHPEGP